MRAVLLSLALLLAACAEPQVKGAEARDATSEHAHGVPPPPLPVHEGIGIESQDTQETPKLSTSPNYAWASLSSHWKRPAWKTCARRSARA